MYDNLVMFFVDYGDYFEIILIFFLIFKNFLLYIYVV